MKFLADLEIYVDRKAGIQIQSLNAIVDAIRDSIINGDPSGDNAAGDSSSEDIKNLQMLDIAHIEDDAYFFNLLHCDLDAIAKDLREAHRKDSDATPDDMIASRFNSIVEDVTSITNETGGTKKNLMNLLLYYFSKESVCR